MLRVFIEILLEILFTPTLIARFHEDHRILKIHENGRWRYKSWNISVNGMNFCS